MDFTSKRTALGAIRRSDSCSNHKVCFSSLPFLSAARCHPRGLSLDQMCIAIQALGYSPNLFKADYFGSSRHLLHTSVASGVSPVLILTRANGSRHAISVAGMALRRDWPLPQDQHVIENESERLLALYVHDDRLGPYLKATIQQTPKNSLQLHIRRRKDEGENQGETWTLTHILVPAHPKIDSPTSS